MCLVLQLELNELLLTTGRGSLRIHHCTVTTNITLVVSINKKKLNRAVVTSNTCITVTVTNSTLMLNQLVTELDKA